MTNDVIDPVEYAEYLEFNQADQVAVGKKWKNCHFPTLDILKGWTGHGYLVWPNEGAFDSKGNFQFFEKNKICEPLLVDLNSAKLVVQLTELNAFAAEIFKTKAMVERAYFCRLAEYGWSLVSKMVS